MVKKKILQLNKVVALLLFIVLLMMNTGIIRVNAKSDETRVNMKKCLLIIGDSRTCALAYIFDEDPKWQILYNYQEEGIVRRVYYKDGTGVVLCGEGGGKYANGAFERTRDSLYDIMSTNTSVSSAKEYVLYNLFGLNDVLTKADKHTTWAEKYIEEDEVILDQLGERCKCAYQFNAGPIFEDGYMCTKRGLSNDDIVKFNEGYIETERVKIIDFYSYMEETGLGNFLNAPDDSGLHYPENTCGRIVDFILSLDKE